MSQLPLSFISAYTRVYPAWWFASTSRPPPSLSLSLTLSLSISLRCFLPISPYEYEANSSGRRDERASRAGGTRARTESVPVGIPWSRGSQERARDPGQGTHDQYGNLANSYNDTSCDHYRPCPLLASTRTTIRRAASSSHVCTDYYVHVCPFKSAHPARVPRDARGFIVESDAAT